MFREDGSDYLSQMQQKDQARIVKKIDLANYDAMVTLEDVVPLVMWSQFVMVK